MVVFQVVKFKAAFWHLEMEQWENAGRTIAETVHTHTRVVINSATIALKTCSWHDVQLSPEDILQTELSAVQWRPNSSG